MEYKEKKQIVKDWINAFPMLHPISQISFLKILGPLLIGFELRNVVIASGKYRPYFVAHPLWKTDLLACLKPNILFQEFKNNRNLQFNISYDQHVEQFSEIVKCINEQLLFRFEGDLSINEFISGINKYSQTSYSKALGDKQRCFTLQTAFYVALYTGNARTIQTILSQIKDESKTWDISSVEFWFGNFNKWFESLYEQVDNREEFMAKIKANKQDKKLSRLLISEIAG